MHVPGTRIPLPLGETELVCELLEERWQDDLLPDEELRLEGHRIEDRLFVSLQLRNPPREERLDLEVQTLVSNYEDDETARHAAYDALDALLGQYLEEDRAEFFPLAWTLSEFDGHEIAFRGEFHRLAVERLADELLTKAEEP